MFVYAYVSFSVLWAQLPELSDMMMTMMIIIIIVVVAAAAAAAVHKIVCDVPEPEGPPESKLSSLSHSDMMR